MMLYLVRHGKARKGGKDRLRPLTQRGISQTEAVAGFLKRLGLRPSVILHSDRVRAVQTAGIIAAALRTERLVEQAGIGPEDSIRPILRRIKQARNQTMIVGHLPFLNELISKLISGKTSPELLKFSPSTVVALTNDEGKWVIAWVLSPDVAVR